MLDLALETFSFPSSETREESQAPKKILHGQSEDFQMIRVPLFHLMQV